MSKISKKNEAAKAKTEQAEKAEVETKAGRAEAAEAKEAKTCAERDELEEAREEIKVLTEEAARARADFYNFRMRVERDRERDRALAAEKTVLKLLPVYENLERVCDAVEDKDGKFFKGVLIVTKQFMEALEALGLEMICTDGIFDPALHEAVCTEPVDDKAREGVITGVVRKGYKLAGRVIIAPQVRVGKFTKETAEIQ